MILLLLVVVVWLYLSAPSFMTIVIICDRHDCMFLVKGGKLYVILSFVE
jgi:hypothetical protein